MKTLKQFINEKFNIPKKTIKVYKLFVIKKKQKGKIFPIFIGKNKPTPIGKWMPAEFLPTKGFSPRPGWHSGTLVPKAPHLMKKDGTMPPNRVWAEAEIPDDVDWQSKADKTKTGDIRGEVPVGGHYSFKRPMIQGGAWQIAGALKVKRILTPKQVEQLGGQKVKDAYPNGIPDHLNDWF